MIFGPDRSDNGHQRLRADCAIVFCDFLWRSVVSLPVGCCALLTRSSHFCEEILWGAACWCGGALVAAMLLLSAAPSEFFIVVQCLHWSGCCSQTRSSLTSCRFVIKCVCRSHWSGCANECSVMCSSLLLLQLCTCRLHWGGWAKATTMSCWTNLSKSASKNLHDASLAKKFGERAEWCFLRALTSMTFFLLDRPACFAPLRVNFRGFIWGTWQVFFSIPHESTWHDCRS